METHEKNKIDALKIYVKYTHIPEIAEELCRKQGLSQSDKPKIENRIRNLLQKRTYHEDIFRACQVFANVFSRVKEQEMFLNEQICQLKNAQKDMISREFERLILNS